MVDMICYRLKCVVHTLSIFPFLCLFHFVLLLSSEAFQLSSGLFYLPQLSLEFQLQGLLPLFLRSLAPHFQPQASAPWLQHHTTKAASARCYLLLVHRDHVQRDHFHFTSETLGK